jgi:hypothetical protein
VRRLVPTSRMAIFTIALVVLWILKTLLAPSMRQNFPGTAFFLDLLTLLLAIPTIYYSLRLFRRLRNRLLWKIRRRLVLAHIFIGAIPVFLVICIFVFSALLFYYQFSYYLISNQIGLHAAQIHAFTLSLRDELQDLATGSDPPTPSVLKSHLDADARYLVGSYPSASIILSFPDPATGRMIALINQSANHESRSEYQIPHWLADREFSGLAIDDTQPELNKARLFIKSFISSDMRPDFKFNLEVSVPFDRYFLGRLKAALGLDLMLARRVEHAGLMLQSTDALRQGLVETTYDAESSQSPTGSLWTISLFPTLWTTGMETNSSGSNVLLIELSTPKLMRNLFRSENTVGGQILNVLKVIVIFFLIVEVASIFIGIMLTKSITNAVHSLDRGTEFVKRGDFSHRIIVRSEDQLVHLRHPLIK